LISAYQPFAPEVEAMRSLRTQLMLGSFSTTSNALAIVSPSSGDGRTFIASNLAIVFSQLGKRTLLVDAHLRNPRVHDLFGLQNTTGLAAALEDGRSNALIPISVPQFKNLDILPTGAPSGHVDDLLARDSFGKVCRSLADQFDVVLFDTPPGGSSSGVDWIADRCGKVLLVVRQGHTRYVEVESFVRRIKSRADIVGSVMNRYRRPLWRKR
jgi:protein-tyrosine kinase